MVLMTNRLIFDITNSMYIHTRRYPDSLPIESTGRRLNLRPQAIKMKKNISIIIAEDDPVNQKVIRLMLKKLGIKAEAVDNGLEVIHVLENRFFDIVLMDIQMPKLDGIEATKIIRMRWPQKPKIIVITDCDPAIYSKLCFEAGADHFLAKPLKLGELTRAIENNTPQTLGEFQSSQSPASRLSA